MIAIDTASGSAAEEATKDLLERLLHRYDTGRWTFADRVVIEEGAIPHSHPVLTIGTRFIVRTPLGLLTTYLHEQLHWFLSERMEPTLAAVDELRLLFPEVPERGRGGANNDDSTYLHLIVNWLELESLKAVAGEEEAVATLGQAVDGPVYGWIYRQVFDKHAIIGDVVRRHTLDEVVRPA